MASVKVAVRVRPFNSREIDLGSTCIVSMEDKTTTIYKPKNNLETNKSVEMEEKRFKYDYSYWSLDEQDFHYTSQSKIYDDLGTGISESAMEGYNACIFAYGQTGSGKTYTMMGYDEQPGLIPRICRDLFTKINSEKDPGKTFRTEVSYLEIYQEHVRDLLKRRTADREKSLAVREHPKEGPYVQGLSVHNVHSYEDISELIDRGSKFRMTASTLMNDTSSRSHAIFTVKVTKAKFSATMPIETTSKVNLVDLAGSERAGATGATGVRLKEGASINKSLVSLGNVISVLADLPKNRHRVSTVYVPYRDSVLTWLLKDSLGGNSKTVMIATISPSEVNYGETLSTLRYANRAKNIMNKPRINEDPNVKLIRELREEINRLKAMLGGNIDHIASPKVRNRIHENEARLKVLTEEWQHKWSDVLDILKEQDSLNIRRAGLGVVLDSSLPHLIGIADDILRTGIMLFHLKEGVTTVGTDESENESNIVMTGEDMLPQHCAFEHMSGRVILHPMEDACCLINGIQITEPTEIKQGAVILLGKTNMFRYNNPAEVAELRKTASMSNLVRSTFLSRSMTDLASSRRQFSVENLNTALDSPEVREPSDQLEDKRREVTDLEETIALEHERWLCQLTEGEEELRHKIENLESNWRPLLNSLPNEQHLTEVSSEDISESTDESVGRLDASIQTDEPGFTEMQCSQISSNESSEYDLGLPFLLPSTSFSAEKWNELYSSAVDNCDEVLKEKLEEIRLMEEDILKAKIDLETAQNEFKHHRDDELDKLEAEKSRLADMENEERINALVEQEVRKRLLEERIQKEKNRRMSKDKLRLGQEKENHLTKLILLYNTLLHMLLNSYLQYMQTLTHVESACTSDSILSKSLNESWTANSWQLKISIPGFVYRGSALDRHFEYEIECQIGTDIWIIYRRYNRFVAFHNFMKLRYPFEFSRICLPPKRLFGKRSQLVALERRPLLEMYLEQVIDLCSRNSSCPLHLPSNASFPDRTSVFHFSDFFRIDQATCDISKPAYCRSNFDH